MLDFHKVVFKRWIYDKYTGIYTYVYKAIDLYDVKGYEEVPTNIFNDKIHRTMVHDRSGVHYYIEIDFWSFDQMFTKFVKEAQNIIHITLNSN